MQSAFSRISKDNSGLPSVAKGLGITTGKTWHGNTAFGSAGGKADGYATKNQQTGQYSNFRGVDGEARQGFVNSKGFPQLSPQMGLGRLPSPGGYAQPVISQAIPPRRIAPQVSVPRAPMPTAPMPAAPWSPYQNMNYLQRAIVQPPRQLNNMGGSVYSYYNNPVLGTPGFGSGLGAYAQPNMRVSPAGYSYAVDQYGRLGKGEPVYSKDQSRIP